MTACKYMYMDERARLLTGQGRKEDLPAEAGLKTKVSSQACGVCWIHAHNNKKLKHQAQRANGSSNVESETGGIEIGIRHIRLGSRSLAGPAEKPLDAGVARPSARGITWTVSCICAWAFFSKS